MGDSVTLRLDGAVTVATFAKAADNFSRVLVELAKERDAAARIDWLISDLAYGSTILTATPMPVSPEDAELIPVLVTDVLEAALQVRDHPTVLDRPVLRLVYSLSQTADEDHEVVLETADGEVAFTGPPEGRVPSRRAPTVALGTIRGRVQTLQQRQGIRFVLYDLLYDKAVTCYLTEDHQEQMRNAWGHLVEVTGMVTRDPVTDRPRAIRRVSDVRLLPDTDAFDFRRARGAVLRAPDAPPSEALIRRLRDAI